MIKILQYIFQIFFQFETFKIVFLLRSNDSLNNKYALSHQPSGFSLHSCSHFPLRKYYYVNLAKNWTDAQLYCRGKYSDLATIVSMDDISRLQPTFTYSWAWIGMADDPKSWRDSMGNDSNSWRSSATGETSKTGYQNWIVNQPANENGNEKCVAMYTNGKWYDAPCEGIRTFVCYNGKKIFEIMDFTH